MTVLFLPLRTADLCFDTFTNRQESIGYGEGLSLLVRVLVEGKHHHGERKLVPPLVIEVEG